MMGGYSHILLSREGVGICIQTEAGREYGDFYLGIIAQPGTQPQYRPL